MKIIEKDNTFIFDVDFTLIMHCPPNMHPEDMPEDAIKFDFYGQPKWAVPHYEHIELLKASVARGRNTIVASGNGYKWAAEVLKKLNLDYLDVIVLSKPIAYCDDQPVETWHGSKFYIPYNPFK